MREPRARAGGARRTSTARLQWHTAFTVAFLLAASLACGSLASHQQSRRSLWYVSPCQATCDSFSSNVAWTGPGLITADCRSILTTGRLPMPAPPPSPDTSTRLQSMAPKHVLESLATAMSKAVRARHNQPHGFTQRRNVVPAADAHSRESQSFNSATDASRTRLPAAVDADRHPASPGDGQGERLWARRATLAEQRPNARSSVTWRQLSVKGREPQRSRSAERFVGRNWGDGQEVGDSMEVGDSIAEGGLAGASCVLDQHDDNRPSAAIRW